MWQVGSSGFCLLLTTFLGVFLIGAHSKSNSSIQFPSSTYNNRQQCTQPVDVRMYKKCRAVVTPAGDRQLFCECSKCALEVELVCRDGQWTPPSGPILCNATSPAYGCGRCVPSYLLHDVTSQTSHEGYLGETRRGDCLQTCLNVVLLCHMDGLWHYDCRVPTRQVIPDTNLTLTFDSDTNSYTFNCASGMTLIGASSLSCINGTFNGRFPKCIKSDVMVPQSPQQFHHPLSTIRRPTTTSRTPRFSTPTTPPTTTTKAEESEMMFSDPNSIPTGPSVNIDGFAEYEESYDDNSQAVKKAIKFSMIDIILIAGSLIFLLLVIIVSIYIKLKYYNNPKVELRRK